MRQGCLDDRSERLVGLFEVGQEHVRSHADDRADDAEHEAVDTGTDAAALSDGGAAARRLLASFEPAPQGAELRATLHTWLQHHGAWDATARALSVHRNVVRRQIAECASLLRADLDDARTRAELLLALDALAESPLDD